MTSARVLSAALAALLITGCSAPTTVSAPASTAAGGPAATTSAPTSAPAGGQEVDKTALLQQVAQAQAFVKTSTTTMDGITTTAGKTTPIKSVIVADRTDPKHLVAKTTMSAAGADINMIIDGDTYYMQMGGAWFKLTKASIETSGVSVPDVTDQSTALKDMAAKVQKIVFVGDESVDGVATKHYLLTLDGSALSSLATGATAAPTTTTIPYDMWVDGNSIMRKFAMTLKQDSGDFSMTGVMSKINESVSIAIPTNAQPFPGQ